MTDVTDARTYCAANPTDFACVVNSEHDHSVLEPAGGGAQYTRVITRATATYDVSTKAALITALDNAVTDDIIYLDDDSTFDMTGEQWLTLPKITICSGRGRITGGEMSQGALITFNTMISNANELDELFGSEVADGRITGLRFKGGYGEVAVGDLFSGEQYSQCFFRPDSFAFGWEVDNCLIGHVPKWGIDVKGAKSAWIHHNTFYYITQSGFGYPVWIRKNDLGVDQTEAEINIIEGNIYFEARHCLGASGSAASSYIARYNIVGSHSMPNHQFDRHGDGGPATRILNNVSYSRVDEFFGGMEAKPDPSDMIFDDNYCEHSTALAAVVAQETGFFDTFVAPALSGSWRASNQPTATILESVNDILPNTTVTFTATGAEPTTNFPIIQYIWQYDGMRNITESVGATFQKTFDTPGQHTVSVRSKSATGLISSPRSVTINVKAITTEDSLKSKLSEWWEFREATGTTRVGLHAGLPLDHNTGTDTTAPGFRSGDLALHFDGTTNYNLDGLDTEEFITYESDVSYFFRIKFTSIPGDFCGVLEITSVGRVTVDDLNRWQTQNNKGLSNTIKGIALFQSTSNAIEIGTWHDVVITYPRQGARKVYVDGVLNSTDGSNMPFDTHFESIFAGAQESLSLGYIVGLPSAVYDIDTFAVWKKELTAQNITDLYGGGTNRLRYKDLVESEYNYWTFASEALALNAVGRINTLLGFPDSNGTTTYAVPFEHATTVGDWLVPCKQVGNQVINPVHKNAYVRHISTALTAAELATVKTRTALEAEGAF